MNDELATLTQVNRVKADLEMAQDNLYRQNLPAEEVKRKKDEYERQIAKLENLKTVKVTLAFSPSGDFVKKMWAALAAKIGRDFVLDIFLDTAIIGGVVIEADGKHTDHSLRRIFNAKTKL